MAAKRSMESLDDYTQPDWPTAKQALLSGGRVLGTDGSLWVYRTVPLEPVADAKTDLDSLKPGDPLIATFEELAAMVPVRIARRRAARNNYRQVHMLLVNVPAAYHLPHDQPGAEFLNSEFADKESFRRLLMFGVRLFPDIKSGGFRSAVDSVAEIIRSRGNSPVEDFDKDYALVDAGLARAGLRTPSDQDFILADSWWSTRRNPATPFVPHDGHLHVFNSLDSARAADAAGAEDCTNWPKIGGQYVMTLAAVQEFELPFLPATTTQSRWIDRMRAQGAVAISIRGRVEPAKVTRNELRRRRKQYLDDIDERYSAGKLDRAEQERTLQELTAVEKVYTSEGAPPTLVEAQVTVALNGAHADLYKSSVNGAYTLTEMAHRQTQALAEMWLASSVRSNPHLHDIPCHSIAYSGLPSLSVVGDAWGAQLGLTQKDRQPAFLSHIAASRGDGLPLCLVTGQTGSGKTVTMLWLAHQFTKMAGANTLAAPSGGFDPLLNAVGPQVIFDPKIRSNHTAAVMASGGHVASLDSVMSADGVTDPMRQFDDPKQSVDTVAAMLTAVNPWGTDAENAYVPITTALKLGIDLGGRCTGATLKLAYDSDVIEREYKPVIRKVLELADTSPLFRASVGFDNDAPGLRTLEGITLIKVGRSPLNLPPTTLPRREMTPPQRAALNLIRQVTLGAMSAMSGRDGVLHLDEGWIFMKGGASEMDEIGRIARSTQVLPILYSQTVTDALAAGLGGYISRQIILPITDKVQATAALELSRLEPTESRIKAITAEDMSGASPNWESHRALRDPVTGKVLRGTIGIYCDLSDRAIPVEILIPEWFLKKASTNADDIARRDHEDSEIDLVDQGVNSWAKGF